VALVIDEAQNLEPQVLEQIRLISNLETETDKLIQIVLAGQPELAEMLLRPELRQFRQRVAVRYHLYPMDFEDTKAYVEHRLEMAGGWRAAQFSDAAMKKIFCDTGGIPRLINIICDRALLIGYIDESREISRSMAARAISELREKQAYSTMTLVAMGACLLAILAVAWAFLAVHHHSPVRIPLPPRPAPTATSSSSAVNGMVKSGNPVKNARCLICPSGNSISFPRPEEKGGEELV
jgi:general secretion pathway protein A